MRRLLGVCLALSAAAALAGEQPPAGNLVLIGGGSKPPAAMAKFVELAGGPGAPIVVFPTASEVSDTGEIYRRLLTDEYGCRDVRPLPVHTRTDAMSEEVAAEVGSAGGIFFAGGDQRRITAALLGTPVGDAVQLAFERGAVVGGTSAGTACQSGLMITGDGDFAVLDEGAVVMTPGLDLFPGVIVDQHFIVRRRLNRLLTAVMEHPDLLGIGIDEGTAVWRRPNGTLRVLGDGWVVVLDAREAEVKHSRRPEGPTRLGVRGLKVSVLVDGDEYDPTVRPRPSSVGGADQ